MSYTEQSDYVPSSYPQRVTVEWRQVIKSLNPMRALRRWWHEYDQPVKQEPLLNVMSNTPVKRRIGRYEYDVYESKIPDAKTPKDRLTHPGWRQAFAHHP